MRDAVQLRAKDDVLKEALSSLASALFIHATTSLGAYPDGSSGVCLGRAALHILLTPQTLLHFRAHLVLPRAYLLLAASALKARLSSALFSVAVAEDDDTEENTRGVTFRTRDRNTNWRAVRWRTDPLEMHSKRARSQP